jgi:hypothetical protein
VQGVTGAGSQGATGIQGNAGATGTQGVTGAGSQGATGVAGNAGVTGTQGVTGAGSQGITGLIGVTGTQGVTGTHGVTGIQGVTGFSEGVTGLPGATGLQGVTGEHGVTGEQGVNGNQGATGTQGVTGSQGVTGTIGVTGIAGIGFQGPQGVTGMGNFPYLVDYVVVDGSPISLDTNASAQVLRLDAGGGAAGFTGLLFDAVPFNDGTVVRFRSLDGDVYLCDTRGVTGGLNLLAGATGLLSDPVQCIEIQYDASAWEWFETFRNV